MPRAELVDLRAYLRLLVGDPAGAGQAFTDDDLDRFLLDHRIGRRTYALSPAPTPDGRYLLYVGPPLWADDVELVNSAGTVLATSAEDLVAGEFEFAATTLPPVYANGSTYDVHAAAVGTARAWIGKLKLSEFDLKVGEIDLSKQQKIENLRVLIEEQLAESAALAARLSGGGLGTIPITRLDTRNVRGERSRRRRRRFP